MNTREPCPPGGTAPQGDPQRTVRRLLQTSPLPRLETQMLLQRALGVSRSWLIAHDTDCLDERAVQRFHALANRRQAGEPMAYITGLREFMGHEFIVEPGVLIPRPETELLVEAAMAQIDRLGKAAPRILDLGTGSGVIAVSIALARPGAVVMATDVSEQALQIARRNATALGARVQFLQGSWFEPLQGQASFDVIVSNPPYIDRHDPHLTQGDLRFEPAGALTDGTDGLSALAHIAAHAPSWLTPQGGVWMEHGYDQASAVRGFLSRAGFSNVRSRLDLAGIERISGGNL